MASLSGLKTYLRYGPDDDVDQELNIFLASAKAYVAGAGLPVQNGDDLYDLLVYMIASHWYDNRGVVADSSRGTDIPLGATSILLQLRTRDST